MEKEQITRYARQIALEGIGLSGQQKILSAKILVVGAGGIGCPVLENLVAAGIGHIHIIDDDKVELTNLQRQFLHGSADLGRAKVDSAADSLRRINDGPVLSLHNRRLSEDNVENLVRNVDLVIDGSDNFDTRFLVNAACHANQTALISAAVNGFEGQLAVFQASPGSDNACYQCLVPSKPDIPIANCAQSGVFGALTATMGAMAAMEALKLITDFGDSLTNKVLRHDASRMSFQTFTLPQDPDCMCCGEQD